MDIEDCVSFDDPISRYVKEHKDKFIRVNSPRKSNKYFSRSTKNRVFIKSYGCSHNFSDSEIMAGLLADEGYTIVKTVENCDICVVNTCTVKAPSVEKFLSYVKKCTSMDKKVVIAGCEPSSDKNNPILAQYSLVDVHNFNQIVMIVSETLKGNIVHIFGSKQQVGIFSLPKIRKNAFIEIVPIASGCLNQCTYCRTRFSRGQLRSWNIADICLRIQKCVSSGVREIRITAEDVGAYGLDVGSNIIELLDCIKKVNLGDTMIRVGMTNPPYILDHLEKFVEVFNHKNFYAFVHIPIQSGSDKVLGDMKREYLVEDVEKIVKVFREEVKNVTIATDIICGFPSETDEDFEKTLELVEKCKFPVINISQMYVRPGTLAAKMKRLDSKVVKNRSRKLSKLFNSYETFSSMIGTVQRGVLIVEFAHDGKNLLGRTKNYVSVLIDPDEAFLGDSVDVEITAAKKFFLTGKVVGPNESENKKKRKRKRKVTNFMGSETQTTKNIYSHHHWKKILGILIICAVMFIILYNIVDLELM